MDASDVPIILKQGIDHIVNNADRIKINKESVSTLENFVSAAVILCESAEAVAFSTTDAASRYKCFEYASKIKAEIEILQDIIDDINRGKTGAFMHLQVITSLTEIGKLTSNLVEFEEDTDKKALADLARKCATAAKEFMFAAQKPDDHGMLDAARIFAEATLSVINLLKRMAEKYPESQIKLRGIAVNLKEITPRMIEAVKVSHRDIKNRENFNKVAEITKELAKLISYAIHAFDKDHAPIPVASLPPLRSSPSPSPSSPSPSSPSPSPSPSSPSPSSPSLSSPSTPPVSSPSPSSPPSVPSVEKIVTPPTQSTPPDSTPASVSTRGEKPVLPTFYIPATAPQDTPASTSAASSSTAPRSKPTDETSWEASNPTSSRRRSRLLISARGPPTTQPVVVIPRKRTRKRTITSSAQGKDVLRRARGATLMGEIEKDLFAPMKEQAKQEEVNSCCSECGVKQVDLSAPFCHACGHKREQPKPKDPADEIRILRAENARLKEENAQLMEILVGIHAVVGTVLLPSPPPESEEGAQGS